MACAGITNPGRVAQLILRDPTTGEDLIVLDILPKKALGATGFQGITLGDDMEGLYRAPTATPIKSHAYQDGATLSKLPRRSERLPKIWLHTQAPTTTAWAQVETLLWTVLSPKWDCYLRLYDDDGTWRELRIRMFGPLPDKSDVLHGARTTASWNPTLVAEDPGWYGPDYTWRFDRTEMTPVSGGFEIDVPITNPTDQLAWLEWNSGELTEAPETWSFQDGERRDENDDPLMMTLPELAGAHKSFWVNTYPTAFQLWVRDRGQDWARMRGAQWTAPIAANTPQPRTVRARLEGGHAGSQMMLTLRRRWDRPYGAELPVAARMVTA